MLFPGFVSGFTGGGVRGNSRRCGHDGSGETDSKSQQGEGIRLQLRFAQNVIVKSAWFIMTVTSLRTDHFCSWTPGVSPFLFKSY